MIKSASIVAVCVLAGLLLGAAAPGSGEAAERAKFVGLWKGATYAGTEQSPGAAVVKLELTITEKTIHGIEFKGKEQIDHGVGEFVLVLDSNPKQLDATEVKTQGRARTFIGIYKLEGDTLTWCVSPQKVRPTTYETKKGQFLVIVKREKK